jgi:hypothetical protein
MIYRLRLVLVPVLALVLVSLSLLLLAGSVPAHAADPPDVVCAGCDWPMPAPADGVPVCSDCDDS